MLKKLQSLIYGAVVTSLVLGVSLAVPFIAASLVPLTLLVIISALIYDHLENKDK